MRENGLEAKALGMDDCNFTHGVTHCSATLRLSAHFASLQQEVFRDGILPSLFVAPSPCVVFCFRLLIVRVQPHAMEYSLLLFVVSLCLSLPLSFLLLFHLFTLALLSRATLLPFFTFRDKPLLYCQPLADSPELIIIRRWKRFNVKMINYFSWFKIFIR